MAASRGKEDEATTTTSAEPKAEVQAAAQEGSSSSNTTNNDSNKNKAAAKKLLEKYGAKDLKGGAARYMMGTAWGNESRTVRLCVCLPVCLSLYAIVSSFFRRPLSLCF